MHTDEIVVVKGGDVSVGKELTFDYAMTDDEP